MSRCCFCNEEIKPSGHIYGCAKKYGFKLERKEIKLMFLKHNYGEICEKEMIQDVYENKLYSLPDIKKEFNLDYGQTEFLLDSYGIKKRTMSESAFLIRSSKIKKTCLEKYGVENVSQREEIKQKKKETFLNNYGVDNIWKSKEYYDWLHLHMLEKYGQKSVPNLHGNSNPFNIFGLTKEEKELRFKNLSEFNKKYWKNLSQEEKDLYNKKKSEGGKQYWENLSDELKTELMRKRVGTTPRSSRLESRLAKILDSLLISYKSQFWISNRLYDFKISNTNILIEVQGDFWHGNPEIYKSEDILRHPLHHKTAFELWEKDKKKKELAEKYNYQVLYIWELDMNNMSDNELRFYIVELLNENSKNQINKENTI